MARNLSAFSAARSSVRSSTHTKSAPTRLYTSSAAYRFVLRALFLVAVATTSSSDNPSNGMTSIPIHVVDHGNDRAGHAATGVATALSPTAAPARRPKRWVVVDFDGTCTAKDTTPLLPRLASLVASHREHTLRTQMATQTTTTTSKSASTSTSTSTSTTTMNTETNATTITTTATTTTLSMVETAVVDYKEQRQPVFRELEAEYFRRYMRVLDSIHSEFGEEDNDGSGEQRPQNQLLSQQLLERLEVSLDKLDLVSTQITELVTESSVLRGLGSVTHLELLEAMKLHDETHDSDHETKHKTESRLSESLRLHEGCLSVLRQCAAREHHSIGVLSINWCPALIRAVLVHPLCEPDTVGDAERDGERNDATQPLQQQQQQQQQSLLAPEEIPVWSNTVDRHGAVSLPIPGAIAKKKRIQKLQQQARRGHPASSARVASGSATAIATAIATQVVYVGDSSTDLLALLQADVGILIGRSESTLAMAKRFGVTLRPLAEFWRDDDETETETEVRSAIDLDDYDNGAGDGNQSTSSGSSSSGVVWSAADWDEIGSFLDAY